MKLNVKSLSVLLVFQLLLALGIFYGKQLTSTSNSEDLIVYEALGEIKKLRLLMIRTLQFYCYFVITNG